MDALKILSRSTDRIGSRKTNRLEGDIPSSGSATNPKSITPGGHPKDTRISEVSKKRKRDNSSYDSVKLDHEVDFFNSDQRRPAIEKLSPEPEPSAQTGQSNTVSLAQSEHSRSLNGDFFDLQRCREVLKSNKIKITRLREARLGAKRIHSHQKSARKLQDKISVDENSESKKEESHLTPQPLTAFSQLTSRYGVSSRIVDNLVAQGYRIPTEVQLGGLPILLDQLKDLNRNSGTNARGSKSEDVSGFQNIDLLTVAPTGSGKTLTFLLPVLESIQRQRNSRSSEQDVQFPKFSRGPIAIIIAPTKELANQIVNEAHKLVVNTGIKVSLVRKGMKIKSTSDDDVETVKSHVLVSTPLTILHAIEEAASEVGVLASVRYLVLDEADVLLDPLFRKQTLQIWEACSSPLLRVSLWSATMGSSIEDVAKAVMDTRWQHLEAKHEIMPLRPALLRLVVGLKDSAVPTIEHKLIYAATEQGKLMALRQLLRPSDSSAGSDPTLVPPFLVFTQTIPRAIALHSELLYDIPQEAGGQSRIAVLHADLSETARDRVMSRFRRGVIWVLITTDLLSRGVDFRGINGVVNYDFPNSSAAYIHRVGRTGRAGREGGVAVTLYAKEDIPYVKSVANVIAASERQRDPKGTPSNFQQWLVNSLPKPSKNDKKRLKKRGVESRRTAAKDSKAESGSVRTKISTKSGYERRLEHNRKGAIRRAHAASEGCQRDMQMDNDGDFEGLSD